MKRKEALADSIRQYAHDLRRNSSGGDDYPWEWARATADYLETLIERSAAVPDDTKAREALGQLKAGHWAVGSWFGGDFCENPRATGTVISALTEDPRKGERTEAAAQVAENYYRTVDEAHEILRANVQSIGVKIAAAIRNQHCDRCGGRGYLVADSEWEPIAVQCPACKERRRAEISREIRDEQDGGAGGAGESLVTMGIPTGNL